jgi:hypothetical protein
MPEDDTGRRILQHLNIEGFTPGSPELFDSIRQSVRLHGSAAG